MTDGVTDDIVWIEGARITGSIPGLELKKKSLHLIYVLYFLHYIYIVYILYAYYIFYILHIYLVKSEGYINRTSFTPYIG